MRFRFSRKAESNWPNPVRDEGEKFILQSRISNFSPNKSTNGLLSHLVLPSACPVVAFPAAAAVASDLAVAASDLVVAALVPVVVAVAWRSASDHPALADSSPRRTLPGSYSGRVPVAG